MLLIDDLLLFPFRSILAVFREIHNAVTQDAVNQAEAIRNELSEQYMMLETGRLSEADFDEREKELLDQLDAIEAGGAENENEADEPAEPARSVSEGY